jgi:hypothetical protein
MLKADSKSTITPRRNPKAARAAAAATAARPAAKAPEFVELYLGAEHWVAAAVPAADQLIILANRDRAELSRMVACWQNRPLPAAAGR